jgi:hypothetical protein
MPFLLATVYGWPIQREPFGYRSGRTLKVRSTWTTERLYAHLAD